MRVFAKKLSTYGVGVLIDLQACKLAQVPHSNVHLPSGGLVEITNVIIFEIFEIVVFEKQIWTCTAER